MNIDNDNINNHDNKQFAIISLKYIKQIIKLMKFETGFSIFDIMQYRNFKKGERPSLVHTNNTSYHIIQCSSVVKCGGF